MKLQLGTKFEFDSESYVFEKLGKRKKITSRIFPSLIGKNKYESVGHALLERFGLLEKEEIHPFYSVRGEIAERMMLAYLKEKYRESGIEIVARTWEAEEVEYDNFQNNPIFGGLIDIAIVAPIDCRAVVEVKSKEVKKYKAIKEKGGSTEEELQGEFLGYMSGVGTCVMAYIFFDKMQELQITEFIADDVYNGYEVNAKVAATKILNRYGWTWRNFRYHTYSIPVYGEKTLASMARARAVMEEFEQSRKIASSQLKADERIYLNTLYNPSGYTPKIIDRPF